MRIFTVAIMAMLVLAQAACGSAERRLLQAEKAHGTDGPIRHLFHASLYYPSEIALQFDGYIVGVEKAPRKIIHPGHLSTFDRPDAGIAGRGNAAKHLDDRAILFVSHILKQHASPGGANCALHNVYAALERKADAPLPLIDFCDGNKASSANPGAAFHASWAAMDTLGGAVAADLARNRYTHVLVVTMGWNTDQIEAVRNINAIVRNFVLSAPAQDKVVPLVIGVTWPSMWVYSFADPVVKFASFHTKADDADELGLTWLGVLLHDTLPKAGKGRGPNGKSVPLIVIGHSFGSRASMVGTCVGPVIYRNAPAPKRHEVDYVFNFQGAFLTRQLLEPGRNAVYFPDRCAHAKTIVVTSSDKDKANSLPSFIPGWGFYAGDDRSFRKYCGDRHPAPAIGCGAAGVSGELTLAPVAQSNILLINADKLITEHAFGSGSFSGAHSDIYRREHGYLINEVLKRRPLAEQGLTPPATRQGK